MAATTEATSAKPHVGKKRKPPTRYWDNPAKDEQNTIGQKSQQNDSGSNRGNKESVSLGKISKNKRKRNNQQTKANHISGSKDLFPGKAPIPPERLKKFQRGEKYKVSSGLKDKLKNAIKRSEAESEHSQKQAARFDLLLPEEAGFLEGDEGEDTCTISQDDIAEAVDITSGAKYFNLHLSQFGPYRLDYSRVGRHLLLGGKRGHVTCIEWQSKQLMSEINVMETVNDVKWLHNEDMFAVAQKKWLYIYDSKGTELHCIRKFNDVLSMQFLPYHFLLGTASATGYLQYLDVSVGKEVACINTKLGRLGVMAQNPQNAIIHLGHPNGIVSLWSPNQREPLVKMLCHQGGVRSVVVDKTGTYMVTSGMDKKVKVYDIRAYKPLQSYFLPAGAACLSLSQRGLLAAATGDVVQVYKDVLGTPVTKPYMAHRVKGGISGLSYCPHEDVLGVGHGDGFSSMIIPGAGEPNYDAMDVNPLGSLKQRREWEVKALLEKIQPDLISLDPTLLGKVDNATWEQRHKDRVEALGYDPLAHEKFVPRKRKKGRSSSGAVERRKRKVAHEDQRDVIRKTVEEKMEKQKNLKKKLKRGKAVKATPGLKATQGQKSALDRFKKCDTGEGKGYIPNGRKNMPLE